MMELLQPINGLLFLYFLIANVVYLALLATAIYSTVRHQRQLALTRMDRIRVSPLAPPISLLVPAHNEEQTIVEAVDSLLALDYPEIEVVVANDGSSDGTMEALRERYQLLETDIVYVQEVSCKPVRAVYMSQVEPRLLVVDKEPGGSKADAVNAALNVASSPYVCVVDADSILEPDALLRIMGPIFADPARVVAAGGIVRVLNGSRIENGRMTDVRLPKHPGEVIQVVEYLRSFLIGREGWAFFNMLTIISGAFGVFRRDLVRSVGGYRPNAIGEDIDLVLRLHRHMRDRKADYQIAFVPDPVCWTEVPSDIRSLARQRARWQKGLLDVLWPNRDMLFRPTYGRIGSIALPYLWVWELFAPIIEAAGLVTIVAAACLGALSREFMLQFLLFGYVFATMISIGSVLLEEITYRRYSRWQDVARLVRYCFLEHFPYRQLHLWWRLTGIFEYLRGDVVWKPMKRVGFRQVGRVPPVS
jgi:cellulose synthase/poly-beta-1,6-N-acetylglucosamine synthase-like glycosyltransferase